MRRRMVLLAALALIPMFLQPAAQLAAHATTGQEGVPSFGHVFVIIGENTDLSQLNKNSAPYQTGFIQPNSALLTNFWGTSHYSTSNYIGMTSGQYLSCDQADAPPATCNQDVPNLFGQLTAKGVTWTAWNESMPSPCYLVDAGTSKTFTSYRVKHNPAVYYADTEGLNGVWSASDLSPTCTGNVISTGAYSPNVGPNDTSILDSALTSGNINQFNYIVPNQCQDGHDNCGPMKNRVLQYDQFLAHVVPEITPYFDPNSSLYDPHSVLFVTYDEGNGAGPHNADQKPYGFGGGNIELAVMGPLAQVATYSGAQNLRNEFGLLRTLEDGFGLSTQPATSCFPTLCPTAPAAINQIWHTGP